MYKSLTLRRSITALFLCFLSFSFSAELILCVPDNPTTGFQTSSDWIADLHIPADVAIVYGNNADKINTWADRGFTVWTMIGASWLGKNAQVVVDNPGIVQTLQSGLPYEMIPGRAWVVPVGPWIDHTKKDIDTVIDAGTGALLPEEPEFFAITGYSKSFKNEWKKFYGEDWVAPDSSPDALWRAGRLKAKLFTDFFTEVFAYTKYRNPAVKCIIPAHSNLNYAHWNIIASHYDFSAIPDLDGFIGQVWTGTAKESHPVGGSFDGRIFNYAFLEYSFFENLLYGTDKEMWFLTDPVEDLKGAPWSELRKWYEQTMIASLMFPSVNRYEVTPWPNRIFRTNDLFGGSPIPEEYATELFTVWSAERMMPATGNFDDGPAVIGALTSDSLMWQRKGGADRFSGFAAPMMALVSRGTPVRVLPVERLDEPGFPPDEIKILIAGFDAWKPRNHDAVAAIADWVKNGGSLIFIGGSDEFNEMENAWWTLEGFSSPSDSLLAELGLDWKKRKIVSQVTPGIQGMRIKTAKRDISPAGDAPSAISDIGETSSPLPLTIYGVPGSSTWVTHKDKPLVWSADAGGGKIIYAGFPGEFIADEPDGDAMFMALVGEAARSAGIDFHSPGKMVMRRGKFIAAFSHQEQIELKGTFLNLLRPENELSSDFIIAPGEHAFLMDVNISASECSNHDEACTLLASGNVVDIVSGKDFITTSVAGPQGRTGFALFRIPGLDESGCYVSAGDGNIEIVSKIYPDLDLVSVFFPLTPEGTTLSVAKRK